MARARPQPDDLIYRTVRNIELAKGMKRVRVPAGTIRRQSALIGPDVLIQPDTVSLSSSSTDVAHIGIADTADDLPIPATQVEDDSIDTPPPTGSSQTQPSRTSSATVADLTASLNASTALLHSLRLRNEIYAADLRRLNHVARQNSSSTLQRKKTRLCRKKRSDCAAKLKRARNESKGWMYAALGSAAVWFACAGTWVTNGAEIEYVTKRRREVYGMT